MTADRLAELVVECSELIERDGPGAVETLCRAHPDLADELRAAIEPLLAFGILGGGAMPTDRPATIGEFAIVRELGRGGMGVVYEATQPSLQRRVALKVLAAPLSGDAIALARFRREGATAARLQHRGIAQVFAVGCADGLHYLAMECIDGAPLDRVLGVLRSRPVGSLDSRSLTAAVAQVLGRDGDQAEGGRDRGHGYVRAVAQIGEQVLGALAQAHAQGVIHRDVKPSNVMMRGDGSVVLTDFGLARTVDDPGVTRPGSFAGTPFYTSPEQAAARGAVDQRTDLFSLGAMLYELLTLQLPFAGTNTTEVLRAIMVREPVDPRRWNSHVPRDLVAILQRLLEKEPARRYRTAEDVAADLRAFLAGRPVTVRPITVPGRLLRWSRRQPLQAAMLAVLAVGVPTVVGLASYAWSVRDTVRAAEQLQRERLVQDALLAGYVALGEARPVEAERQLRLALTYEPGDAEAWAGLAQVAMRGDAPAAAVLLDELAQHPRVLESSRAVRRCRAELLSKAGHADLALQELQLLGPPSEALESFWVGMQLLGRVLGRDENAAIAEAYHHLLDAVVETPAARPAFLYWLAVAAGELGEEAGARRAARALASFWPESGYAWAGVGLALHKVDPVAAVDAYRRALTFLPDMLAIRNNLANALDRAGKRRESMAELREILARKPDYGTAHYNLGRALFYERDYDEASVHLQRAVELDPDERRFRHYLSWCLLTRGLVSESLTAALDAVLALPDDALLWRDVARGHMAMRDPASALPAAQQALALAEEDPESHALLADVQAAMGDKDGARRSFDRRIELAPDGMPKQRAREDMTRFLLDVDPAAGLAEAEQLALATRREDPWVLELLADAQLATGAAQAAAQTIAAALQVLANTNSRDGLALRRRLEQRRQR